MNEIEIVARTLCKWLGRDPDETTDEGFLGGGGSAPRWRYHERKAIAVIAALDKHRAEKKEHQASTAWADLVERQRARGKV